MSIPEPPLSEYLQRLAYWADRIRDGTHEMTPQGREDFAAVLHLAADRAEQLEAEAAAARSAAVGAAVRRVLADRAGAPPPIAPTSEHFTVLIDIACGRVPGVVLLPVRYARAVPWGQADEGGAA